MTTSHDANVTVSVSLDAPPSPGPEFQIPILLVPLAANSLDGDRVRAYSESGDVDDDEASGFISSATAAELKSGFSQDNRPRPPTIKVAYVDLAGTPTETYDGALSTIREYDAGWYGVSIQDRATGATHKSVSDEIQSMGDRLYAFQSGDADWKTSGLPTAYSGIDSNERTLGCYHDNTAEALDFATLCAGLQDPDSFSAPWLMNVGGVDPYTTDLTPGERLLVLGNNVNVFGEFGPSTTWLDAGVNMAGRTMRAIIMRDWLRERLKERAYDYIVTKSNSLEPIEVTPEGQNDMGGILEQLINEGDDIGHFIADSPLTEVTYPTITQTDLNLRRVRVEGKIAYVVDGRLATFTVSLEAGV